MLDQLHRRRLGRPTPGRARIGIVQSGVRGFLESPPAGPPPQPAAARSADVAAAESPAPSSTAEPSSWWIGRGWFSVWASITLSVCIAFYYWGYSLGYSAGIYEVGVEVARVTAEHYGMPVPQDLTMEPSGKITPGIGGAP